MVEAKTVDLKISASKKVIKRALKKQSAKNVSQDVEISKLKAAVDQLKKKKSKNGHVSEYNLFVRKQIKAGLTFSQSAKEWNKYKALQKKKGRKVSAYNQFIGSQMRLGKTFTQSVALWKLAKAGTLGKKGKTRTITKTLVKLIKSKPITRTVTKTKFVQPAGVNFDELKQIISSSASSSISKSELKSAFSADDEEIAFKLIQTYFMEIARMGFKRNLSLDEIIDSYFYALAKIRSRGASFAEVEAAIREMEKKK
ncbi:MAG: hypothetical protein WCI04_01735 [archaeon]